MYSSENFEIKQAKTKKKKYIKRFKYILVQKVQYTCAYNPK